MTPRDRLQDSDCGWLHPFVSLLRNKYPEVSAEKNSQEKRGSLVYLEDQLSP